jgi:purine-cytosine permease-like protein
LGDKGSKIAGVAFAISLMGWFSLQLAVMTKGLSHLSTTINHGWVYQALTFLVGALLILSVLLGIKGLQRISNITTPFLMVVMGYIFYLILGDETIAWKQLIEGQPFSLKGAPLVLVSTLMMVIDIPTYYKHAKNNCHGQIGSAVINLLLTPFVMGIGIMLAILKPGLDITASMMGLGGDNWKMLMVIFFFLGGWSANTGNLYSASMALSPLPLNFAVRTLILGVIAIVLTTCSILESYESTLNYMSILLASVGAVIVCSYCLDKFRFVPLCETDRTIYYFIILGSAFIGLLGQFGLIKLTTFGFLDTFIVTILGIMTKRIIFKGDIK